MKKLSEIVLFLLLSAFCVGLAACSSDDDGGISVSGRTLEPYLPDEFSSKKVDALYGGTFTIQTYEFTKP